MMIKHIFLLLAITLSTITLGVAQESKLYLGPELGANVIPLMDTDIGQNVGIGLNAGLRFEYQIKKNINLQTGLYLSQRQHEFDSLSVGSLEEELGFLIDLIGGTSGDIGDLLSSFNLDIYNYHRGKVVQNNLELPLLVGFKIGKIQLSAGPYASWQLSAKTKTTRTTDIPLLQTIDIADIDPTGGLIGLFNIPEAKETETTISESTTGYTDFDYGFKAGIGYSNEQVRFNLLYTYGLPDYLTDSKNPNNRNVQYIQFTTSYVFGLPRRAQYID